MGCSVEEAASACLIVDYGSDLTANFFKRLDHLLRLHKISSKCYNKWHKKVAMDKAREYATLLPPALLSEVLSAATSPSTDQGSVDASGGDAATMSSLDAIMAMLDLFSGSDKAV